MKFKYYMFRTRYVDNADGSYGLQLDYVGLRSHDTEQEAWEYIYKNESDKFDYLVLRRPDRSSEER
jgi:hypothetical protein